MRRAWVDVDLGALLRNGAALAAQARVPLLPMVKADAYGLGAVRVARTLERLDPWGFGVATIAEGEELRRAGITRPIIVFTPLLESDFDAAQRAHLTPSFGDAASILRWAETARPWHLSIDTGMSRAGIPWSEVDRVLNALIASPPQGAFTHFHSADRNDATRDVQEERFAAAIARLPERPTMLHAENSSAIEYRGPSKWDVARPGIFLYGVGSGTSPQIHPAGVVAMRARIVDIRSVPKGDTVSYGGTFRADTDRRIATLAVGYADGYRRVLGNRASVLLDGKRAPVVGVVTMDMTMVDVTDVRCEIGDVATLIGNDGEDRIDVRELADLGDLSPYEILTGLRGRLPRRYLEESA
ncbi:MAG TPA: alanine racemase [Gemmatimonadaceae bacterium]|nr:alanine racemase [Gemmatimonadaceae bacterium]